MKFLAAMTAGLVLCGAAAMPALAKSDETVPLGMTVGHGWTRQTKARGQTTPAYFTIHNAGTTPDTLVSTSCPIAHHTLLLDRSGQAVGGLVIKPGETVTLAPDRTHLMLQQNRFRFYAHAMIPCSVDFLDAGKVILYLHVEPDDAKAYEQVRRPIVKN
ncbi:copper chaperone PCu(A)C [Acidiphilium sp. PA]|uniref:copper chaperone PCu(A)C n=1 Tax=Acidiphilium sp. PA TaxID=2871705 RepID=UPI002243E230|nr:copper chaperone PCu(A)C [Acidiphilium sp. PA]MCW8306370.1 copper chaperone PCu(A)C [Acidiphilium sp. PA]